MVKEGEAGGRDQRGTERSIAERTTQDPTLTTQLMEAVWQRENLKQALNRVKANQGSPGIDGMRIDELPDYLRQHWPAIRAQRLEGTYQPQPVKRVEIDKPAGGVR